MLFSVARARMIGARGLDRTFHRLGARIGQKDRVGKGVLDEPRGIGLALRAAIEVRHMHQRRRLILDRLRQMRSEEHTSEFQSLMRISYAVFCLKQKKRNTNYTHNT